MANKLNDSCAPTNAVQNLAKNYGAANSRLRSGVERQIDQLAPSGSQADQFAQEFLSQVGRQTIGPSSINVRQILAKPESSKWADDFALKQRANPQNQMVDKWATDFRTNTFNMNKMANDLPSNWANEFSQHSQVQQLPPHLHEQWSKDFDQWIETSNQPMPYTDNLENVWDNVQNNQTLADEWAHEFTNQHKTENLIDQETLNAEFDKVFQAGMDSWTGIDEINEDVPMQYDFNETNPYLNSNADLMEKGQEQIRSGNTQEAILAYEAQVQKNPRDAQAWCQLGLCHAENEHDLLAMTAFKKALEINPKLRDALLGYSVSLANENYSNEALNQLERWLDVYMNVEAVPSTERTNGFYGAFIDPTKFARIESRYLDAARAQTNADPELQNALGVLYNLNGTFDRAVDSIKTAIARNQDDARLWNRLGATLANSERTAEAIEAYRHALQLFPAYVRARYNLGISCMHLNCYREAADHFLSALRLQNTPETSPIWSTLRSAIIRMEKANPKVMEALNLRDVESIQQALVNGA